MRMSLALAIAALASGCAGTVAHQASARVHFYNDARLSVVSPSARDEVQRGDSRLAAQYAADVVTGATQALTVDAVSAATRFTERRHQLAVTGAHALAPETEISGGYSGSFERDDTVHAGSLGLSRELLQRMVRATARYQLLAVSVGRVGDETFSSHALGHRLDLGWTQIASTTVVVTGLATATAHSCSANIGCFANPYRYVGVKGAEGGRIALRERHPDARITGALALRVSWAFANASALHFGYRLATDSWGLGAQTADAAVGSELFARRLLARLEARATLQGAASFYASSYAAAARAVRRHRTADAELSTLRSLRLQLHLEWSLGPVRLVGELGRQWMEYPRFPALPHRHAWLAGLGLDADF